MPEAVELKTLNTTKMRKVGECIVALFTDGAFPGEVTNVEEDFIEADFYVKANIKQSGTSASLWKRSSIDQKENYKIHKNSLLPVRPVFGVNKFSTHRCVIFELLNAEYIEKFT